MTVPSVIELSGKRVVVVGLGASGVAAARLALSRGARVTATDQKVAAALPPAARDAAVALEAAGASLVLGGHAAARLEDADIIVVSPGVPTFPELRAAEARGVPVIGEVELAVRSLVRAAPIVAVGGTNGKSTTTSIVGAILEADGRRAFVGGNLGEPLSAHAGEPWDAIVLEVSSFQMERAPTFHPRVSILLNVTDDHLDRYADLDAYAHAKGNAFANQALDDLAVVPVADAVCARQAARGRGRVATFGRGGTLDVTDDSVTDRRSGERWARADITISGEHNAMNVAAAVAAALELGVSSAAIGRALSSFRGLPHRMTLVRELGGIRFYDDSKGTNVGASVTALRGLREPRAVLIAGGRDKGGSYAPLVAALEERGRAAIVLGEAKRAIAQAIGGVVPVHEVSTLGEAVLLSRRLAGPGDAVLLSPACSSYDMFTDYKQRGDEFARAVHALAPEETG
ncbi:MAG: UDP-N-acetylmuramoyl-L-alanine--D-glutamate ligase [Polyangiaceae bacterium]